MAQAGYTPIQLYFSTTAAAVPTSGNLASGELAINITDGKLYFKNNSGTVTLLAGSGGGGPAAGSNTQIQYNDNGVFGASSNLVFVGNNTLSVPYISSNLTGTVGAFAPSTGDFTTITNTAGLRFKTGALEYARLQLSGTSLQIMGGSTSSAGITLDSTNVATFLNNPIISGGTASGVTYLNGSKVLTSGSALNFNGTSLAIGDTAASADGSTFYIYGNVPASTQLGIKIGGNANSYTQQAIRFYDTYFGAYAGYIGFTTNSLTFGAGTTEGMRLTSTSLYTASGINAGFGISAPVAPVTANRGNVSGAGQWASSAIAIANPTNTGSYSQISFGYTIGTTNASAYMGFVSTNQGTNGYGDLVFGTRAVNTDTQPTERLRLDSAGNLGLGVTPSASSSLVKAFDFNTTGGVGSYSNSTSTQFTYLSSNAFLNSSSNWIYKFTGVAANAYLQGNNTGHIWYTAASGTAGGSVSFTQAMTLDASGNLLLGGTSSGSSAIELQQDGDVVARRLLIAPASGDGNVFFNSANNAVSNLYMGGITNYLHGFIKYDDNTDYMAFGTNTSERARIDSSGNLLVGSTSLPAANRVKGFAALSNSTGGIQVYQTANNSDWAVTSTSGNVINFYSDSGSALVYSGSIAVNGVVTTYGSVSDYRLKENVEPMQNALAKVLQLKPVTFAFKNSGQNSQGFIAHELQQVCPDAVIGEKDAIDSEGKPQYQGIDTSFLVATLTAAIQELKAELDAYKASHP